MTYEEFKSIAYRKFISDTEQRTKAGFAGFEWTWEGFRCKIGKYYYVTDSQVHKWNSYFVDGIYVNRNTFIEKLSRI